MSSRRSNGRVGSGRDALENEVPLPPLPDHTTNLQWGEVKPLSGKPYFYSILANSNLYPRYYMWPARNFRLELPSCEVPTILTYMGKSWDMVYHGKRKLPVFSPAGWKKFAVENCLRVEDACIFELMESSDKRVIFEVQILRCDIPSEILENEMMMGQSREMPIVLY
ncbi:B3 domain-containing protein Os04g0386900-like [Vigna unguiculata]|uniref:B3 domain-containing protein Os04g0386900-like n=1 Tax=Vigna unguiculata TaxID=3917 RepID=UPI0010170AC3|nr:B3 domain-containing protein Os04g0386900-like [Vigna unguiculata]